MGKGKDSAKQPISIREIELDSSDSETVLRPLSHDLREVIRSIRFRISDLKKDKSNVLNNRQVALLKTIDTASKKFGEEITRYRQFTNERREQNNPVSFADVERFITYELSGLFVAIESATETFIVDAVYKSKPFNASVNKLEKHVKRLNGRIKSLSSYAYTQGEVKKITRFGLHNEIMKVRTDLEALRRERRGIVRRITKDKIYLSADQIKIALVIQNLIHNSLKYVEPDKKPEVTIDIFGGKVSKVASSLGKDLSVLNKHKYVAGIEITDNGIGIPEEEVDNIFEPSYRGAESRDDPGSGMGLAIVIQVVMLHDGYVFIDSEVGEGTTMTIVFPQSEDPLEEKIK